MKILDEGKEEDDYIRAMDAVSCTIYKSSLDNSKELYNAQGLNKVSEGSKEIGIAAGQIVLDKIIEITKDMSRDDLVRWLAQSSAHMLVSVMNNNPKYRHRIQSIIDNS
jgi:hypothetical protein